MVVVFLTGLVFSSCRQEAQRDVKQTELVFGVENDLINLDPIKAQEPYTLQVLGQMFEGLVTLNEKNEIVPALAESWSHNEDFTVWQFQIRKGVYFHEDDVFGTQKTREMTAEDVKDSFQRVVSKDSYPSFVLADIVLGVSDFQSGKTQNVAGIRTNGTQTFEIQLQKSEPYFIYRITSPWFSVYPKEAVGTGQDVFGRTKAVGTGPYKLVQRDDTEVVLEKNTKYWKPVGGDVAKLHFRVIKNEQIRLSELRNGNISMTRLPLALAPSVINTDSTSGEFSLKPPFNTDYTISSFPTFNTHLIGFNCDKMDVHLRRAISLAINRQELVKAITFQTGVVTTGTVPVGLMGYQPPYPGDIFNLEKAKEELKLSKFDASKQKIELLVHEKENTEQLGQLIQSQLKELGIELIIQKLDYNAVLGRMVKGDTQAFAISFEYVFSSPEPILNNIFNSEKIPVPNFWHYKNSEVDAQLDKLRTVSDRTIANGIAQNIEKQVIDDAPAAFLYQLKNLVLYRKNISNIAFNGHGTPLLWEVKVNN